MTKEQLGEGWFDQLSSELQEPYIKELKSKLTRAYSTNKVYPKPSEVFKAFQLTPFENVKVVLLGQDPYPNDNAHGLSFSSQKGVPPPSLMIILRELDRSVFQTKSYEEFKKVAEGADLSCWARQGVFLLNSVLTVDEGNSNSHADFGWQRFTSKALEKLWIDPKPKVFVLWGVSASETFSNVVEKTSMAEMPARNHLVLLSGHPATAFHGKDLFSGNNHFVKINKFLHDMGHEPINWEVHGTTATV